MVNDNVTRFVGMALGVAISTGLYTKARKLLSNVGLPYDREQNVSKTWSAYDHRTIDGGWHTEQDGMKPATYILQDVNNRARSGQRRHMPMRR